MSGKKKEVVVENDYEENDYIGVNLTKSLTECWMVFKSVIAASVSLTFLWTIFISEHAVQFTLYTNSIFLSMERK